jgi:hypothetical protein
MSGLVWRHREDGGWVIDEAPTRIEVSLTELCGSDLGQMHGEGRHLVVTGVDKTVWYLPTGYDTSAGLMHLTKDREEAVAPPTGGSE